MSQAPKRRYKHLLVKGTTHERVKKKATDKEVTVDKVINIAFDFYEGKKNELQ